MGRSISLLIPDGSDEMVRILGEIAVGECVDHCRMMRLRKDGTSVPMSLTASRIYDRDGATARAGQAT